MVYASHAFLPQGRAGIATIAYELIQQMTDPPGTVLVPVGHGSLLLGLSLGFQALKQAGVIQHLPMLIAIQAAACAPLVAAFDQGLDAPVSVPERKTIAAGVQISNPYHGKSVLHAVRMSSGKFLAVEEKHIRKGQRSLSERGIHAELTAGLVWSGLEQIQGSCPEPILVIITGHGLKSV
jgi:threonine synthase